ncbi:MAG: hypothetical protein NT080_10995 [Spirochaetes bacterium]|nr:hypothetical protein [Spirochaetota bacterium]
MPTQAAQVIIAVIPIVGIVMGCFVLFFSFLWSHKEKMAMMERGIYVPVRLDLVAFSLFAGLLLSGVGFVLTIVFAVLDGLRYSIVGGAIPLAVGLSLLAFYRIRSRNGPDA